MSTSADDQSAGTCPLCGAPAPPAVATTITVSERAAVRVARIVASWRFVGFVLATAVAWVVLNLTIARAQPFPTVMISGLAAGLALLAAVYGPVVLLTQRVEAQRDRERARAILDAVLDVERTRNDHDPPESGSDLEQR